MKRASLVTLACTVAAVAVYGTTQVAQANGTSAHIAALALPGSPHPSGGHRVTVNDVIQKGPVFGIQPPSTDVATIDSIAASAGCRPGWIEVFAGVTGGVTADVLASIPGVPVLSIEPWDRELADPTWSLASTIKGAHDVQYTRLALAIHSYNRPVMIRFAHEMNGRWYPWGVVHGNTPAQYVAAWRHVVTLFQTTGVTNALWIWSPNILRGAVKTPLSAFYPGDSFVDFAGLTGYGEYENNPDETYDATLTQLATVTHRHLILTEVGVRPSSRKTSWLRSFGSWLAAHPQIVGFLWSEHSGRYDWRFDDEPTNLAAFKSSLQEGHAAC